MCFDFVNQHQLGDPDFIWYVRKWVYKGCLLWSMTVNNERLRGKGNSWVVQMFNWLSIPKLIYFIVKLLFAMLWNKYYISSILYFIDTELNPIVYRLLGEAIMKKSVNLGKEVQTRGGSNSTSTFPNLLTGFSKN